MCRYPHVGMPAQCLEAHRAITMGDQWKTLVTRLLEPVPVSLGELLALTRANDLMSPADVLELNRIFPDEHHFDCFMDILLRTREATFASSTTSASRLAYLRALQNRSLAELQDMAAKKNIPYDGKAATRLRLDLADWVQQYPIRPPEIWRAERLVQGVMGSLPERYPIRPPGVPFGSGLGSAVFDPIRVFLEAETRHLQRKTVRRDVILNCVRPEVGTTRRTVWSYWGREGWDDPDDESPSGETSSCAKNMEFLIGEDDASETGDGDLTGYWSQEEEDIGDEEGTRLTESIWSRRKSLGGGGWRPATCGIPVPAAPGRVLPPARARCLQEMTWALEAERRHLLEKARQQEALLQSAHYQVCPTTNTHQTTTQFATNRGPTTTAAQQPNTPTTKHYQQQRK